MNSDLLVGVGPLLVLVLSVVVALAALASPLFRQYPDDQGDGMALVLLPPPRLPSQLRVVGMAAFFVALNVLYHSVTGPLAPDGVYARAVMRLSESVVRAPTELDGYFAGFRLGLRFLIVATMLSLAVTVRATPLRRLLIAVQALWYVAAMLTVDALLTVVTVLLGLPVAPSTLLGNLAALMLGFVALGRVLFANFALPKPSAVPFAPRPRLSDAVTLVGVTVAAMALSATVMLKLYQAADPHHRALLAVFLPVPFTYVTQLLRSAMLWMLDKLSEPPEPAVADVHPPIEVIIPAYNEEEVIVDTLRAIDAAAERYLGPVGVILANDGSTDRTSELAKATMGDFRFATGRVIDVRHGGKSATLNSALGETTADIVVRIDADTLVDEWSLHYLDRWFRDPQVGQVEAMMFPRWRRSPFPRMRLFEELKQFGLVHRTIQVVDGVNVIPGVFTAFRREPAVALGGFTVGMNGEDGDFTLRFSRLGYRSVMDPKVVVYEDVPPTYWEIREQRVRWDRATIHNDARHGPHRAGVGTPKVWFSHLHQIFLRAFAPVQFTLPLYLLLLAVFEGSYRYPILLFIAGWLIASISFMAVELYLSVVYRHARYLPWLLAWPVWRVCIIVFSVEAWLSLPGRPASWRGPQAQVVVEAVVH